MHPTHDGCVRVRGAREHNLRDVDVAIPRDAMVVFTGVSGSGKSSLAFGTIYAEAQRRYFESVAPYARRLLQQAGVPDVDEIDGLPPAVALQQRRGGGTSRSTVGTITTLSNLLRMLLSRAGSYPEGATEVMDSDWFSPNTAVGACPECHGLGKAHRVTEDLLVPDRSLTIRERAVAAWPGAWQGQNLRDILISLGYDVDRPWRELPKADRDWILYTDEQPRVDIDPRDHPVDADYTYTGTFSSAERHVMHTLANSKSATMRERALQFVDSVACPLCGGTGLRPEALAVTFAGLTIAELAALAMDELADVLRPTSQIAEPDAAYLSAQSGETSEVAVQITRDLCERIGVLVELGLGYLSLDRTTTTLSPGELQRLRLATQLRSGLFGVVYVLDEPSAGLHPADAEPLLEILDRLKAGGNSLFVVEHDMDVARQADWIVDVGPGAGEGGGRVLYSGPIDGLEAVEASVTRRFLFGRAGPEPRAPREPEGWLHLEGVSRHNLDDVDVDFPLGALTAVTGVSGSGKSTLVNEVLADGEEADEEGLDTFDRVVRVDQKPIGRTPRSNLATYTGMFDAVRKVFADTEEARRRGYTPGRFSFNVAGGRCETCEGEGFVAVELLFLPGTYGPCPTCHGARYNPETLEVHHRGTSIADVLQMTVTQASGFLADVRGATRSLETLLDVGLGYLRLGQPATELSGGEAQRIKLASELQRGRRGHSLYILDEPTTGLHPADIELLVIQLQRLVDAGNTVVVVEHDMDVVASADWVIDLGPGAGAQGGRIVAAGTPAEVAASGDSRTAPYLAAHLAGAHAPARAPARRSPALAAQGDGPADRASGAQAHARIGSRRGRCTRRRPTKGLDMCHGADAGSAWKATRVALRAVLLAAVVAGLATPAVADAASVAYVDNGEVWLASLDGTKKARLATTVVNGDGDTEKWLDVAQSDGGRIVAVRNKPGRISNFSWFKIWEPNGTSTVEGPLNAPGGWTLYVYPLGFDITANGSHLVYGYSNSGSCCPTPFGRGTYIRPATNSTLNPIDNSSQTHPSLFGSRIVSLEDSSSPTIINVQDAAGGNPYTNDFTPWLDTSAVGLDLEGVDVAANGRLAALGFETWSGGTQTVGRIAVIAIDGVDQGPTFSVDCSLPAAGVARDASLAQDAGSIAWEDDGGVKVAGSPTGPDDPCVMGSAPVVLSPTGEHPSIGGADVAAFLPALPPATPPAGSGPGPGPGPGAPGATPSLGPRVTLPAKLTAKALATSRGVAVKVKVTRAGKVSIKGTVPARRLGRRGKPVIVVTGKKVARAAGTLTIRLRLNAVGRKRVRRLKGARLTLRIVQGSRSQTKVIKLR